MDLAVRPVTPDLWPALDQLFGRSGASNGCWCMYWRLGPDYARRPRDDNRVALRSLVEQGPPPGLLAFEGDLPVGWCQFTPRTALPWLDSGPRVPRVDDRPVWSISCFFVRRSHRRRGVATALIEEAVRLAREQGIAVLEAYPIDMDASRGTSNPFTGVASSFRQAGFEVVGARPPARLIVRLEIAPQTWEAPPPG